MQGPKKLPSNQVTVISTDDAVHTVVSTGHRVEGQEEFDNTTWVLATIYLNGVAVATGVAPERPPYVEGTARSTAISIAQNKFILDVLSKNIRDAKDADFKTVKGPS